MIRPPRGVCSFISRNAACVQRNAPVRLTSTTRRHCSTVRSSSGTGGAPVPALLNSRSRRPKAASVASKRARTDAGIARRRRGRPGPARRPAPASAIGLLQRLAAPAGEDDRVALAQQRQGRRPADAGPRAGDDRDLPEAAHGFVPRSTTSDCITAVSKSRWMLAARRSGSAGRRRASRAGRPRSACRTRRPSRSCPRERNVPAATGSTTTSTVRPKPIPFGRPDWPANRSPTWFDAHQLDRPRAEQPLAVELAAVGRASGRTGSSRPRSRRARPRPRCRSRGTG